MLRRNQVTQVSQMVTHDFEQRSWGSVGSEDYMEEIGRKGLDNAYQTRLLTHACLLPVLTCIEMPTIDGEKPRETTLKLTG